MRLVASLVKGKNISQAVTLLEFLPKRAGVPFKKLLLSAISNAKQMGKTAEDLFIKELTVDKGVTLKRMMPAAMGSAHRINKRSSHVTLALGERAGKSSRLKSGSRQKVGTKK